MSPRRRNADFIEFFRRLVSEKRHLSGSAYRRWKAVLKHFENFSGNSCTFAQLDESFIKRFRHYLLSEAERHECQRLDSAATLRRAKDKPRLASNTAKEYFDRFLSAVKEARERNFISDNPAARIVPIKLTTPQREFLTLDEIRALAQTPGDLPDVLRRAALFSVLSGLRFSDIQNLTWANVRRDAENDTTLHIRIKKTGEPLNLPISIEAHELLGETGEPNEKVFKDLKYDGMTSVHIDRWTTAAGIARKVTFHVFRRSYATGLITGGVDFYTVSGLLAHSDVRQTKIYAHLVDQKRKEAANKISLK